MTPIGEEVKITKECSCRGHWRQVLFEEGRGLFWRLAVSGDGSREQGAYYLYSENFDKWHKWLLPE